MLLHISSHLCTQYCPFGSLALVGAFTPWKLANSTNQGFYFLREPVVKYLPAHHCVYMKIYLDNLKYKLHTPLSHFLT